MNSQAQTAKKYLMVTACAGVFTFGVVLSFLGATLPELRVRLGFGMEQSGTLFTILFLAQIPLVFVAGPIIDRFGKKPVLAGGSLICAATLLGINYAPSYAALGALLFVLGIGGSFMNSGSNTLIPDLYPDNPSSALNLGNIFFSLGAVFFPLLVALLVTRLGLSPAMWLIALVVAGLAAMVLAQNFPPASAAAGLNWREIRRVALDPAVMILALVLFFYSALEVSTGGWLRTYLEQEFHVSARTSSSLLTLFWIVMMLGRLAASQIVKKIHGPHFLLVASGAAIAGLVVIALAPNAHVACVGIVICGLSYAPFFPTTAGTASSYFPKLFGTVFGILMAVGLTGAMVVPLAIGYLAEHASVRSGIRLLVGTAALLFLTQAIFVRHERRRLLQR